MKNGASKKNTQSDATKIVNRAWWKAGGPHGFNGMKELMQPEATQ